MRHKGSFNSTQTKQWEGYEAEMQHQCVAAWDSLTSFAHLWGVYCACRGSGDTEVPAGCPSVESFWDTIPALRILRRQKLMQYLPINAGRRLRDKNLFVPRAPFLWQMPFHHQSSPHQRGISLCHTPDHLRNSLLGRCFSTGTGAL